MTAHRDYVRDLFYLIREIAAKARKDAVAHPGHQFHEGREQALIEVLSLMQSQATSFMLDRVELGMDAFDPLNDRLEPFP